MAKSHGIVVLAVGVLIAAIFGPALAGHYGFAYRDAAHFYHPLFEFVRAEWSAGRVPLWNPCENLGVPLAGDATSSVFYPGKLLFALPLDYTLLFNGYVVAHLALAAATSFRLARHFGASAWAAGLAAVSYAFSGNVMFQHCNVVFLVGAAWLPLALELADRSLREGSWRAAIGMGVVLALMVTGGDPQMAYNAGLLAVLDAAILWRASAGDPSIPTRTIRRLTLLLAVAAGTGLVLSAVQTLPSRETARQSLRASYDSPRNLYELGAAMLAGDALKPASPRYAGLLGMSNDEHAQHIYQFNLGPWRAIELLWPNVAGRHFPVNSRWLDVLPAEGRVWTPSLYMGLLPVVLALSSFSVRRRASPAVRWLSWMTLLGVLAGLGVFGVVWWVREVGGWFGASIGGDIGDEVGGLYWLMTVVLPGYVYFRYPAKLLVVACLGLSMLAALGWDALWRSQSAGWWRCFAGLAALSFAAPIAINVAWPSLCDRLQAIEPNELFGPFDCRQARMEVSGALGQTAILSALFAWLIYFAVRKHDGETAQPRGATLRGIAPGACLLLTVIDLAIAGRPLVPYAPATMWQGVPRALELAGTDKLRVYRDPHCWNEAWRAASSPHRVQESLSWKRATLFPKYNLSHDVSLVDSPGTLAPYDVHVVWDVARNHADGRGGLPAESVLRLLGVSSEIIPQSSTPHAHVIAPGAALVGVADPLPRAWIVHDVHVISELAGNSPAEVNERTQEVLFPADRQRDWAREAVVETDAQLPDFSESPSDIAESCEIVSAEPQRVAIEVQLASPGLVVLADACYPGWTLKVETDGASRDVPILRTNRVLRGAALPAGRHKLVYRYRPATVIWGAAISGVSLLGLLLLLFALPSPGRDR